MNFRINGGQKRLVLLAITLFVRADAVID